MRQKRIQQAAALRDKARHDSLTKKRAQQQEEEEEGENDGRLPLFDETKLAIQETGFRQYLVDLVGMVLSVPESEFNPASSTHTQPWSFIKLKLAEKYEYSSSPTYLYWAISTLFECHEGKFMPRLLRLLQDHPGTVVHFDALHLLCEITVATTNVRYSYDAYYKDLVEKGRVLELLLGGVLMPSWAASSGIVMVDGALEFLFRILSNFSIESKAFRDHQLTLVTLPHVEFIRTLLDARNNRSIQLRTNVIEWIHASMSHPADATLTLSTGVSLVLRDNRLPLTFDGWVESLWSTLMIPFQNDSFEILLVDEEGPLPQYRTQYGRYYTEVLQLVQLMLRHAPPALKMSIYPSLTTTDGSLAPFLEQLGRLLGPTQQTSLLVAMGLRVLRDLLALDASQGHQIMAFQLPEWMDRVAYWIQMSFVWPPHLPRNVIAARDVRLCAVHITQDAIRDQRTVWVDSMIDPQRYELHPCFFPSHRGPIEEEALHYMNQSRGAIQPPREEGEGVPPPSPFHADVSEEDSIPLATEAEMESMQRAQESMNQIRQHQRQPNMSYNQGCVRCRRPVEEWMAASSFVPRCPHVDMERRVKRDVAAAEPPPVASREAWRLWNQIQYNASLPALDPYTHVSWIQLLFLSFQQREFVSDDLVHQMGLLLLQWTEESFLTPLRARHLTAEFQWLGPLVTWTSPTVVAELAGPLLVFFARFLTFLCTSELSDTYATLHSRLMQAAFPYHVYKWNQKSTHRNAALDRSLVVLCQTHFPVPGGGNAAANTPELRPCATPSVSHLGEEKDDLVLLHE